MDTPVRISFGVKLSESQVMESTMDWQPWFNGPQPPAGVLFLALKWDYSGVDLLYLEGENDGKTIRTWLCHADGQRVTESMTYCAWMPAPRSTPRYVPQPNIKAVK